jgi:hypothetical protein
MAKLGSAEPRPGYGVDDRSSIADRHRGSSALIPTIPYHLGSKAVWAWRQLLTVKWRWALVRLYRQTSDNSDLMAWWQDQHEPWLILCKLRFLWSVTPCNLASRHLRPWRCTTKIFARPCGLTIQNTSVWISTLWKPQISYLIPLQLTGYKPETNQTPWLLVRKWTIPTERQPLVDEI